MDEDYNKSREELLENFRQSLRRPIDDRYFDEDDLVEIFDYAGDLGDDYLRMEALMCGARYHPESQALYERRGIFYAQYSDDALDKFVEDAPQDEPQHDSMILQILTARRNKPQDPLTADILLHAITDSYDQYSDEEVIQLVDLIAYLNRYEWLKDNLDELRAKAQYPNVLLYETAVLAEGMRNSEYAAQLVEELTQIEPFNSYYWTLLAKQYAILDDTERALSAIDYSLAINPDDAQANLVKARILYAADKDAQQVIQLLEKSIESDPSATDARRMLAGIYSNDGHTERAQQILSQILDNNPRPEQVIEIVPELILLAPDNVDELLDLFYSNNEENSQLMWASWAQQLSFFGYPQLSRSVIRGYERNSGNSLPSMFTIEDAFVNKNFGSAIKNIGDYIEQVGASESDFPAVAAMHLLSLVKSGALSEARQFCEFFHKHIDISKYKTLSNRLEYMGLLRIVNAVKRHLDDPYTDFDWQNFDPLDYWSNP